MPRTAFEKHVKKIMKKGRFLRGPDPPDRGSRIGSGTIFTKSAWSQKVSKKTPKSTSKTMEKSRKNTSGKWLKKRVKKKTPKSEKRHLPGAPRGDQNPLKNHPGATPRPKEGPDGAQDLKNHEKSLICG